MVQLFGDSKKLKSSIQSSRELFVNELRPVAEKLAVGKANNFRLEVMCANLKAQEGCHFFVLLCLTLQNSADSVNLV